MPIYEIITPESQTDSNYFNFEYLLGWFDFNGVWQQKLFTDWQNKNEFDNKIYNVEKAGFIGALLNDESKSVLLTVNDATLNDLKVFISLFRAEKVIRIFSDGTTETVAPNRNSIKFDQRGIRFQFDFELILSV